MQNPIVSFIIPVYNGAATIGACIASIINASLNPIEYEIICVDDASTDGVTGDALHDVVTMYPSVNIRIITHMVNKRQGGARNTGVRVAKGKYIMFIDCDDTYYPVPLRSLIQDELIHSDFDLLFFSYTKNGQITSDFPALYNSVMSGEQLFQRGVAPWGPVLYAYKKELLLSNKCFFMENRFFEDVDYTLKVTILAKSVKILPLCVYNYVVNANSTSNIGYNQKKIEDSILSYMRVFDLSSELEIDKETAKMLDCLLAFMYKKSIFPLMWRLRFGLMYHYMRKMSLPQSLMCTVYALLYKFPMMSAYTLCTLRPLLRVLIWGKECINKRKLVKLVL